MVGIDAFYEEPGGFLHQDIFTKTLTRRVFVGHRDSIGFK